jgi:hypothetical protein
VTGQDPDQFFHLIRLIHPMKYIHALLQLLYLKAL